MIPPTSEPTPTEIRQRILLISLALGAAAGVGLYVAWKALNGGNVRLLAVLLALGLIVVPLVKSLLRLRRLRRGSG